MTFPSSTFNAAKRLVVPQKGLRSFGYDQGRYLIDAERSNESEHLVHHFHKLCYDAIRAA